MGVEPKQEDVPVDYNDLPFEVQDALSIYNTLPARIAEFSGTYLGKDYQSLGFLFDMFQVEKSWHEFYFRIILLIDSAQIEINDKKRKAQEASSKAKGSIRHG